MIKRARWLMVFHELLEYNVVTLEMSDAFIKVTQTLSGFFVLFCLVLFGKVAVVP